MSVDKPKVVVTGASGFIGQTVIDYLECLDWQTISIDRAGVPLIKHDLRSPLPYNSRLLGAKVLIHLAATSGVAPINGHTSADLSRNNVESTKRALELCEAHHIPMMINASSSSVYGGQSELPFKEHKDCTPLSPYGYSKLYAEDYLTDYSKRHGVKVISYRLFNAIGINQRRNMLPWLIMDALNTKKQITLFGHTLRSWTAVQDIARTMVKTSMLQKVFPVGHTILNYGHSRMRSQIELFLEFEKHLEDGRKVPYIVGNRRDYETDATLPCMENFRCYMPASALPTEEAFQAAVLGVISSYTGGL